MKKPKFDLAGDISDLSLESLGFAHALNLLFLAIGKTNPAVGALLDEFTATHAEYFAELQALGQNSDEVDADDLRTSLDTFTQAAKSIYKRLSALDAEHASTLRSVPQGPVTSLRIH